MVHAIPDLYDATIEELCTGLRESRFTSTQLVSAYFGRIAEVNTDGPKLRAVIETNAAALAQAARCDKERGAAKGAETSKLPSLHGIPILVKDNIGTCTPSGDPDERMNTSVGSLALVGYYPAEDAAVIQKLRASGAIILGKTNMSEWAHWRGGLPSGWSSVGGQCTNPYYPGADPSGSSSGSAVASAIGLAAGTLATETDGSIASPSSLCNVVGLKPTVGLTSRSGIVPISASQDSAGPICRTVTDVAHLLQVIAGPDLRDPSTSKQPKVPDYLSAMNSDFVREKKIGVLRGFFGERSSRKEHEHQATPFRLEAFEVALEHLKELGGILIDPVEISTAPLLKKEREKEMRVFYTEFKIGINEYLSGIPDRPTGIDNLGDVIKYNRSHTEAHYEGEESQDKLIRSNESVEDEAYEKAKRFLKVKGGEEGIDACMREHGLDALVAPWSDQSSLVPAVAGYPILTSFLPDDFVPDEGRSPSEEGWPVYPAPGLPFGVVFIGGQWSERTLLGCAYGLEQSMKVRWQRKAYDAAIPRTQLPGFDVSA